MTGPAPLPRRPLLPATFRGVAAVWLWRRVKDQAGGAPAALAAVAGEQAGRELEWSLVELREAARQWEERFREVEGSGSGTAELVSAEPDARSGYELLTTAQAADVLGVSDGMVRRWCRDGVLAAGRRGGSWVVERGSVLDLRDERRDAA
ncbi:helix-turn-helix domain-containing protein [Janibacter indicus]|uniref:helix-turn-helix domain-containing protein n=1 Tax=Janibacter indicus TaxID=857417 RepID=UPI003D9A1CC6